MVNRRKRKDPEESEEGAKGRKAEKSGTKRLCVSGFNPGWFQESTNRINSSRREGERRWQTPWSGGGSRKQEGRGKPRGKKWRGRDVARWAATKKSKSVQTKFKDKKSVIEWESINEVKNRTRKKAWRENEGWKPLLVVQKMCIAKILKVVAARQPRTASKIKPAVCVCVRQAYPCPRLLVTTSYVRATHALSWNALDSMSKAQCASCERQGKQNKKKQLNSISPLLTGLIRQKNKKSFEKLCWQYDLLTLRTDANSLFMRWLAPACIEYAGVRTLISNPHYRYIILIFNSFTCIWSFLIVWNFYKVTWKTFGWN